MDGERCTVIDDLDRRIAALEELARPDEVIDRSELERFVMPTTGVVLYRLPGPVEEYILSYSAWRYLHGVACRSFRYRSVQVLWDDTGEYREAMAMTPGQVSYVAKAARDGFAVHGNLFLDWFLQTVQGRPSRRRRQESAGCCCPVMASCPAAVSGRDILIGELAKVIRQNGVELGQNRMFAWLRDMGYLLRKRGEMYNMPSQRSMERGLFRILRRNVEREDGDVMEVRTVKVTPKGQRYFIGAFVRNNGNIEYGV